VAVARASGDQRQFFEVLSRMGSVQEESGDYVGAQSAYRHALHVAFELNDQEAIGESLLALGRMLMNDTPQLNRVVQLLEEAAERLPDNVEARRLLTRAKTRQERLTNAGVTLMLPETDVRAYASASMDES
jgi:cytochrome c-type biogenesis protein CcmH/NrfG